MADKVRKRSLPHIDVDGKPFFVTGCMYGSIPSSGLRKLNEYRQFLKRQPKRTNESDGERRRRHRKLVFKFVDDLLDGECSVNHFEVDRLAEEVVKAFHHFAETRYHLLAYVVMPSHHHWLFLPTEKWLEELSIDSSKDQSDRTPREIISHSVQSFTAHQCNKLLGKSGPFWQRETWDHYARNDEETLRIIEYIENNPVKAGLVPSPELYSWSSAQVRQELGIVAGSPIPQN